jgi:hypothetical protein
LWLHLQSDAVRERKREILEHAKQLREEARVKTEAPPVCHHRLEATTSLNRHETRDNATGQIVRVEHSAVVAFRCLQCDAKFKSIETEIVPA